MLYHCKCTTTYLSLTNRVHGTPRIQLSLCINNCWQPDFLYRYLGIPKDWRWSMCRNPTQLHVKRTSVEALISSCENGENTEATVPRHTARLERVWSAWSMALWANFHWSCTTCRTCSSCFRPRHWERFPSQHSSGWCQALSGSITCYINVLIHTAPATSLHWATDAGERIKKRYSLKKHYPHNQKPEIPLRGRKGKNEKEKWRERVGLKENETSWTACAARFCLVDTRHWISSRQQIY